MNTVGLGIIENNLSQSIFISSIKTLLEAGANQRRRCSVVTAISAQ